MFSNVGHKLKILAIIDFILLSIVGIILFVIDLILKSNFFLALLKIPGFVLAGYISALPTYALGEIAEKANSLYSIRKNVEECSSELKSLKNMLNKTSVPSTQTNNKGKAIDKQPKESNYKNDVEVVIPDGTETIWSREFANCEFLEKITIPATVKAIEDEAFKNCKNLSEVIFCGSIEKWKEIEKAPNWKSNAKFTTIKCSNGSLTWIN